MIMKSDDTDHAVWIPIDVPYAVIAGQKRVHGFGLLNGKRHGLAGQTGVSRLSLSGR